MRGKTAPRGFAVMLSLFAVLLFGALATAMVFAAGEETRASGTQLGSARALASAEAAVWQTIGSFDWGSAFLLRPGQFTTVSTLSAGNLSNVIVVRLDSTCFFVQASSAPENGRFARKVGVTIELAVDSSGIVLPLRLPNRAWTELF